MGSGGGDGLLDAEGYAELLVVAELLAELLAGYGAVAVGVHSPPDLGV